VGYAEAKHLLQRATHCFFLLKTIKRRALYSLFRLLVPLIRILHPLLLCERPNESVFLHTLASFFSLIQSSKPFLAKRTAYDPFHSSLSKPESSSFQKRSRKKTLWRKGPSCVKSSFRRQHRSRFMLGVLPP